MFSVNLHQFASICIDQSIIEMVYDIFSLPLNEVMILTS